MRPHRITTEVVTITPTLAAEWLEKNTHNRPFNEPLMREYAAEMRAKKWRVNGEAIIWNEQDVLDDGQHRLWACIEAKVSFDSLVVRGVSKEAFATINTGKRRSSADVLAIDGWKKNRGVIAAAAALIMRYDAGQMTTRPKIAPARVLQFVTANEDLEYWVDLCIPAGKRSWTRSYATNLVAVAFLAARTYRLKAAEFVTGFASQENLPTGSPILALLQRLGTQKNMRTEDRTALAALAWNAFIENRKLVRMQMYTGDNFPKIKGAKT